MENQNKAAEDKLAARLAFLIEKGLEGAAIHRDTLTRKIRAQIRKVNYRLACIAAQEKLNAERAQTKAEKLAKEKSTLEKPPAETTKGVSKKKGKKEKTKEPSPATNAEKAQTEEEKLAKEKSTGEKPPAETTEGASEKKEKKEKTKEPSLTTKEQE